MGEFDYQIGRICRVISAKLLCKTGQFGLQCIVERDLLRLKTDE